MNKIDRIKELVKLLNSASDIYYNTSDTVMTDFEFDSLLKELSELEKETGFIMTTSPTHNVGYEVKSELKKNTDFGYRGDRDVSLSPKTKQVLIETDASKNVYSFFTRCWFQFVDDKLFSITLNLNEKKIDHASIFTSLSKKYGNPSSISPKRSAWQDDSIIMSLERPLTLKYIDNAKFQKMLDEGNVQKTIEEKSKDEFLESL